MNLQNVGPKVECRRCGHIGDSEEFAVGTVAGGALKCPGCGSIRTEAGDFNHHDPDDHDHVWESVGVYSRVYSPLFEVFKCPICEKGKQERLELVDE